MSSTNNTTSSPPAAGAKQRHEANKRYLAQSHVAEVLNDMVTLLVCSKPEDELEALIYFLEQRQQQQNGGDNNNNTNASASFSPRPPSSPLNNNNNNASVSNTTNDAKPPASPLSAGATFRRRNVGGNGSSPKNNNNNAFAGINRVPSLLGLASHNEELEGELSTFDLIQKFCLNDDILFEQVFPPNSFVNENRSVRGIRAVLKQGAASSPSSSTFYTMLTKALENNQKMLQNALLLASSELAVDKSLLHGSLQRKTSSLSKEMLRSSPEKISKILSKLIISLEKRIARTVALKGLVLSCSSENNQTDDEWNLEPQTEEEEKKNKSRKEYDVEIENTIFFHERELNDEKLQNMEMSSSTEIELLLSEFIANAQIAVQVLEQQHQFASSSSSSSQQKNDQPQHPNSKNSNLLFSQTQIDQWIQHSLHSIEVATKLREDHRRIFILGGNDNQEKNDSNSNSTNQKEQYENLRLVSPSLGVSCSDNDAMIREFVNEGRKFIQSWMKSEIHQKM